MKRDENRMRWGEGWLLAVVLCIAVVCILTALWSRRPRTQIVAPAHAVLQDLQDAPLNLNAASADELAELPGIGEGLAGRILEYREANGSFASVDELDEVPGIGPGTIEKIRNQVSVE